jgi:NAD+ synthase (glutamine-hydrolysing)
MRLIKIGLANANATVGAFTANVDQCVEMAHAMASEDVTVALFPEQMIGGYAPEDLIQWRGFVDGQWAELQRFASETADLAMVSVIGAALWMQGLRYNCAAVVAGGEIIGVVPKQKLPTYNIFYEGRTISRGLPLETGEISDVPFGDLIFGFDFGVMAVEICEDIWSPDGPMKRRCYAGAELVCNISASPFRIGVHDTRRELIATRAADNQCTIAYVNMVGANDGLIFDGGGYVNQNGKSFTDGRRFERGYTTQVVDLDRSMRLRAETTTWRDDREQYLLDFGLPDLVEAPESLVSTAESRARLLYPVPASGSFFLPDESVQTSPREAFFEEILDALALGIGDYFEKIGAFKVIGVSLSGGRDSLLTLLIAHRYASRVRPDDPGSLLRAFYQPSRFSSDETRNGAETICRELGVPLEIVSIEDAFVRETDAVAHFLDEGQDVTEITRQNIQARIRATRMWNWSNSSGGLFLQTGNMSEKAVGYTTIGGDLMGALAVLANVPKTVVMALLDYLSHKHGYEGIAAVLVRPAGPELAPNQRGEDELMPFPVLDACFYLFAGEKLLPDDVRLVVRQMFPEMDGGLIDQYIDRFVRLFLQSIYKWVQSPLSLHIGNLDLERERALQLPVVTNPDWTNRRPPVA